MPDIEQLLEVLDNAVEVEEGNYKVPHDPDDPGAVESEPWWMYEARRLLAQAGR